MTADSNMFAKYTRQARLPEVGERGQARLCASVTCVGEGGLADEIEARYLAGAGLRVERREEERAAAREEAGVDPEPGHFFADPAAREVAEGARRALDVICRVLEMQP